MGAMVEGGVVGREGKGRKEKERKGNERDDDEDGVYALAKERGGSLECGAVCEPSIVRAGVEVRSSRCGFGRTTPYRTVPDIGIASPERQRMVFCVEKLAAYVGLRTDEWDGSGSNLGARERRNGDR
ncbi:hypothetical protein PMIN04_009633 [Paraphaeosphaeria minitans]